MAHNVIRLVMFGTIIGQCGALTSTPNGAEQNHAEGVSPNTVLCSLATRIGRRAVTVCYAKRLENSLKTIKK
jgi:hypothetical protein